MVSPTVLIYILLEKSLITKEKYFCKPQCCTSSWQRLVGSGENDIVIESDIWGFESSLTIDQSHSFIIWCHLDLSLATMAPQMSDDICENTNSITFWRAWSSPCDCWRIWNVFLSFIYHASPAFPWLSCLALPCDSGTSPTPQRNFLSLVLFSHLGDFTRDFQGSKGGVTSWNTRSSTSTSLHPHPLVFTTSYPTLSFPYNKPMQALGSSASNPSNFVKKFLLKRIPWSIEKL